MLVGVISIVSRYVRMISTDVAVLIGKIGMMNDGFSYAPMAEGFMHQTLNLAIKVRVLVGVPNIGDIARRS